MGGLGTWRERGERREVSSLTRLARPPEDEDQLGL